MVFLVERMPPKMHVRVSSRHEPGLPLARWRSIERLSEVGTDDLRFSMAEAEEFLPGTFDGGIDPGVGPMAVVGTGPALAPCRFLEAGGDGPGLDDPDFDTEVRHFQAQGVAQRLEGRNPRGADEHVAE